MSDPKLLAAAEEIKAIIGKFDLAACIVIASPTSMEFVNVFQASWTCISVEDVPGGKQLHIKAKRADFPTEEEFKTKLTDTVGMVVGFADVQKEMHEMWVSLAKVIGSKMEIQHATRREGGTPLLPPS